ncbi:MAG: hypothetical protein HS109_16775 [Burkholderiales bacterium]|nr:hypothetical protein [Burkholderiales bacterium]
MLLFVSAVKLVAEIALMALVGQGVLAILAGSRRDSNVFYQLFQVLTGPFVRGARLITPRIVLDRHVPIVAFLLLAFTWLFATGYRIQMCVQIGIDQCR